MLKNLDFERLIFIKALVMKDSPDMESAKQQENVIFFNKEMKPKTSVLGKNVMNTCMKQRINN